MKFGDKIYKSEFVVFGEERGCSYRLHRWE